RSGRATPEGTAEFARQGTTAHQLAPDHFRTAPGGLTLSSFGLGTYLGRVDGATDLAVEQSVALCLASRRVNIFDTAINYRHQRAERSLGRALQRAASEGRVAREQTFVATKNGYLAPDAESGVSGEEWIRRELLKPGVLRPSDIVDGSHAMSRTFLQDQFNRSCDNLGLATIDLVYLHNAADAQLPVVGREMFLARLEEAFTLYESLRDQGELGSYGLATWDCLRIPRSEPGHFALEDLVRVAEKVGGDDHGLAFVQFPFNLVMPEAARLRTQTVDGARLTVFEAAKRLKLGTFTSVPLLQGRLAVEGPATGELTAAQTALQFARSAPGTIGPVVGQKTPEHLAENLRLAESSPWDGPAFAALLT
ncbi:MAG: aldo/keto reductase, partial [Thermoplasmata archaeon]|nr:aldo/keto reductase [Thermoplasmata archaeon]